MVLRSIIDLNDNTVALINNQEFKRAAAVSSLALKRYRADQASNNISSLQNEDADVDQCMLFSTFDESIHCADKTFVYDQGIVIPSSIADCPAIASILIFNCALAHHLYAETMHEVDSQLHLRKAKRMYQLAHQVRDADHNFLFHFAVVNNIAVIEAKLGEVELSKKYFEYLMTILMLFIDQGRTEHARRVLGFLSNVQSKAAALAAAAWSLKRTSFPIAERAYKVTISKKKTLIFFAAKDVSIRCLWTLKTFWIHSVFIHPFDVGFDYDYPNSLHWGWIHVLGYCQYPWIWCQSQQDGASGEHEQSLSLSQHDCWICQARLAFCLPFVCQPWIDEETDHLVRTSS